MEKLYNFTLKCKWFIICFVLITTVYLGYQIPNIKINSDVINSLPEYDPDAVLFKKIGAQFGGNKMGMIILECDNVFTPEVLEHVTRLTDSLKEMEGISSVTSLSNIMDVKSNEDGMEIGKLIDEYNLPQTPEEFATLKKKVLSNEMYKGAIVSADGTATIIIFSLAADTDIQDMAKAVKDKTESLKLPEKIYYAGSPMMISSIAHLISADLKLLLPIAFLVIALVLYLGFFSLRGVILPLLTAILSIIWVIGIMALTGFKMSMVSNNIPIVLLAVGTAYAIHVINSIDQLKNRPLDEAIVSALSFVTIPVLLAALTTMIGFVSFIFGSYLTMIRDFGIFTALGTLISLLLSLFFVPAIISAFSWRSKKDISVDDKNELTFLSKNFLAPLQNLLIKHPKNILFTWIIIVIISLGGVFMIHRSVDVKNYFRKGNPTRIAEDIMTKKFGGTKPIFVLFKGDIQNPEVLKTMLRMEKFMKARPDIVFTQSIADIIVDINTALGEGTDIPDSKEKIEQLWFLLDGNEFISRFVSENKDEAIIISKYIAPDIKTKIEFAGDINKFIKENASADCSIEITGMPFIEVTMDKSLINSQMGSLALAILFVIIIVGLILKSFSSGIYAAIPILAAIIILFGLMGFTGIPLNIATVLVASIALGIGIDYSIHVISHFNHSLKNGSTVYQAIENTIGISGKAIIINLTSVSAGFLVLIFSEMVPLENFGLLIALSMIGSGLGALTLLPVILILTNKNHKPSNLKNTHETL